ncbi:hypothetical protein PoB_002808100 [Plakobranchus ocellatus]|uniref:Uncharacterized protein n=1 Tax=Plakobranchus ocellatus TaxID=259542 RepID=A0AAV4A4K9_9GAST|nr:hypothetical protein PoB_002808100 [Plakobranchus ocellatus]
MPKSPSTKRHQRESTKAKKNRITRELDGLLPKETLLFVATQIRPAGRNKQGTGNWWTPDEKSFLSITPAQKHIRCCRNFLNFLSESTLRQEMRKVQIHPGFNENILLTLQHLYTTNSSRIPSLAVHSPQQ